MNQSLIPLGILLLVLQATQSPATAAFRFFDPENKAQVPALLSATGFYDDIQAKRITAGAVPFEVNSPLWSDGAAKRRWVVLKPGTRIQFTEVADYYGYPDGAVFVKEFSLDTVPGDAASRLLWETRLLVNKKDSAGADHWHGFSYRWDRQGKDARLVNPDSGKNDAVRIWPQGRTRPSRMKKWTFPSQQQCLRCHLDNWGEAAPRSILGFFTAQLNKEQAGGNQIKRLFDAGVFAPFSPLPDFSKSPRWASLSDASASLDLKARSYLAANCSGCHGDRGIEAGGTFGMCSVNFDFYDMKKPEEKGTARNGALEYQYTSRGNPDSYDSNHIVTPKHPEFSSIMFRQERMNEAQPPADPALWTFDSSFDFGTKSEMPPLARYEADTTALKVLAAWINSLPERSVRLFRGVRPSGEGPRIAGGSIRFPVGASGSGAAVLMDMRGRRHLLESVGPGNWKIPPGLDPGLHVLVLESGKAYRIRLE
ncbi:MAG TPA: hypothetical protein VJ385_03820 [Fibrobacteria bacterium]|nr:hypothetical protein [Fibrobacteria bacterium]